MSWVGGSILSATILLHAATEAKHFSCVSILLQEAGKMGLKPWSSSLHVPIPYHGVSSLLTYEGKKNLEDEMGPKSHQLAHNELCVTSGVLLFIWFFSPHNSSSLRVFRGFFFPWICWPHAQNNFFFFQLAHSSAIISLHSCTCPVHIVSVYIIFSDSAHTVAAPLPHTAAH